MVCSLQARCATASSLLQKITKGANGLPLSTTTTKQGNNNNGMDSVNDDFYTIPGYENPCEAESEAMITCVVTNDCERKCAVSFPDGIFEDGIIDDDAINDNDDAIEVEEFCTAVIPEMCLMDACCPDCQSAAGAFLGCYVDSYKAVLEFLDLNNLTAIMMNEDYTNVLECDVETYVCGDVSEDTATTDTTAPEEDDGDYNHLSSSILEFVSNEKDLANLLDILKVVGLEEVLDGEGPFTVFLPTNAAFAALDSLTIASLISDVDLLTDVLRHHVVEGQIILSSDLRVASTTMDDTEHQNQGMVVQTLNNNKTVSLSFKNSGMMINDAVNVERADIMAANGVIHIIDAVLIPSAVDDGQLPGAVPQIGGETEGDDEMDEVVNSIVDIALGNTEFSTLVDTLVAAGLIDYLSGEGPFTVFAPTNKAFQALDGALIEALLTDVDLLIDVLLYHVVDGAVMSTDLVDGAKLQTLNGDDFTVSLSSPSTRINNATVTTVDLQAGNGILHVIDTVLLPPSVADLDGNYTSDDSSSISIISLASLCTIQLDALGGCATENMCQEKCFEDDGAPFFAFNPFSGATLDARILLEAIGSVSTGGCDQIQESFCKANDCCSECSTPASEYVDCMLAEASEQFGDLAESILALSPSTLEDTVETPPAGLPAGLPTGLQEAAGFVFECNLLELSCDNQDTPRDEVEGQPEEAQVYGSIVSYEGPVVSGQSDVSSSNSSTTRAVLIDSSFLITSPSKQTAAQLKANGDSATLELLARAFQGMVEQVVMKVTSSHVGEESKSRVNQRHLEATGVDATSSELYDFQDTPCMSEMEVTRQPAAPNCITVFGKYRVVAAEEEDIQDVYVRFKNATAESIISGALEASLQIAATESNQTSGFTVEGLSPVVDANFDPFTEIENGAVIADTVEPEGTSPPTTAPTSTRSKPIETIQAVQPQSDAGHGYHFLSSKSFIVGMTVAFLSGWVSF